MHFLSIVFITVGILASVILTLLAFVVGWMLVAHRASKKLKNRRKVVNAMLKREWVRDGEGCPGVSADAAGFIRDDLVNRGLARKMMGDDGRTFYLLTQVNLPDNLLA